MALKGILRKVLRIILWIIGLVPVLAFCIFLLLKVPTIQGFIKDIAVHYLNKKLNTEVQLGKLHIDFPKTLELDSLFVADRRGDTLVYAHRFFVDINMFRIFSGDITINRLSVSQLVANIDRSLPDTAFNFDFIVKAFASGSSEPDTSASSTRFAIHDIDLEQFRVRYKDVVGGYDGRMAFQTFKTHFKTFDLDSMRFRLDSLVFSHVTGSLTQLTPLIKQAGSEAPAEKSGPMPDIAFHDLVLDTVLLNYNNPVGGMAGSVNLDTLSLAASKINMAKQDIDLAKMALRYTNISFSQYQGDDTTAQQEKAEEQTTDTSSSNWVFKIGELQLAGNHLKYDDRMKPPIPKGIDYNHLGVDSLRINVTNGYYAADSSHAFVHDIALREKSGFNLKKLTTEAVYTAHRAELNQLDLRTPKTHISKKLAIYYDAIGAIDDDPGNLGMEADLSNCAIDLNDVLYFQPALDSAPTMNKLMHSLVKINGQMRGKLKDLHIDSLDLQAAAQTNLTFNGHITGMPDMDKTVFDVVLKDFSTGKNDVQTLLAERLIPAAVDIPAGMSLSGHFKGSLYSFATRLFFRSTDGNVDLQARVKNLNDSLHAGYDALVKTNNLDLGRLLKDDSLYGKVTMQMAIKGSGLTKNSADAMLEGNIVQAWLKGYNYQNMAFSGNYNRQHGELTMKSLDPNISFRLVSSADLSGAYPGIKLDLDLDSADLYALHLTTDTLKLRGKVKADFPSADLDHANGNLFLADWQIVKDSMRINLDSVSLRAVSGDTTDSLRLEAPFARATFSGQYQLSKLGIWLQSLTQHYFGQDSTMQLAADSAGQQNMHIDLAVFNHPLWQMFLPGLKSFSGGHFTGELSSFPSEIQLQGNIPQVVFSDMTVDSISLAIHSDTDKLNYLVAINQFNNGSIMMHKTTLSGDASGDEITVDLKVRDEANKNKYQLAGLLGLDKNNYKFSFNPDSLLLNYEKWQMGKDNYIFYSEKGVVAHNVKLERNGQFLSINSPEENPGSPLEIDFHDFNLATLTRITSSDTALVSGALNGKVVAEGLPSSPVFTADLNIDSLALQEQSVGNIALKVNNKIANAYAVEMALTGDSNDLKVAGTYYTGPQSRFDINVDVAALNIASAQAFTFGQVKDGSGLLTGQLHLEGTTKRPQVDGALTFKNAALTVAKVNDYIRMPNETIRFDNKGIHFDRFTIIDSLNNKAFVNGDILSANFRRYRFALDITARNFRALNAKQNQDEMYYGPVFISANVKVRGDQNLPKVDMNLKMNRNSILTVVLPGSNPSMESSEGIVEFVDVAHMHDTIKLSTAPTTRRHFTPLTGIQLSANITVDTAAVLNLIIDPTNGDNLRVKGDATLNMTMDPGGKISLTGRYEISEGAYSMSLERLIRRRFDIKKGSTITWTGDPTSATLDLTAIYKVDASAMELVEDQLTNLDESTKNTYKQKLPFELLMNIDGQLMQPDISFGLDMPETSRNAFNGSVYTRINQINTSVSEVNKQVLGLLVLGHFIADNPFETSGGGSAEQLARQSASKILSQQLNNLAGDLIKGVDINFDLQSSEDYSTGKAENRTDLNVGLSKSLFNDRTTVYVGSNIQLEGPQQADQRSSQIAGDVAIEYKLSRDGRYRLRGYRKNKYEGVIEGEFIETGLSFIIVMDYNHFKELFQKRSRRRYRDH